MTTLPPALSIMQPWAYLIAAGFKDVENRSWRAGYRGPVLIHAGLRVDADVLEDLQDGFHPLTGDRLHTEFEGSDKGPRCGGIVGIARMVDCVRAHPSRWFVGPHAFVLADARPLSFVPCRGALGFFNPGLSPADAASLMAEISR